MTSVRCQISVSLDGFVAGPNQSLENPLGEGGMRLHEWVFATEGWRAQHGLAGGERNADSEVIEEAIEGIGAYVMGRKMFGGGEGAWERKWTGWWGQNPPFHAPVFVLTHYQREPLPMQGGTAFTFVTDGAVSALEQAQSAAAGKDVSIAGGASCVRQYLAAGLLDELYLHIVPITLGSGERLLDEVDGLALEPLHVTASPTVTHIRYRVVR